MRIRKRKQNPGMPPDQVEALGRLSSADFSRINAAVDAALRGCDTAQPGRDSASGKPPLLIGGESPEVSLAGESLVLDRNGKPVICPGIRCIAGQKVGIDWVSCVFHPHESWAYLFNTDNDDLNRYESDEIRNAEYIKDIFAWVLGLRRTGEVGNWKIYKSGLNGYKYALGMPYQAGIVHVGHSSGTSLVTISGQGALVATAGWELRLHRFLTDVKGWLTRIDMAFDDYEGQYFPVRTMREKAKEGAFCRAGRPPKIELRGAWEQDDPNNSGLTLYVGTRMSGKFTRIYEKGKQLGDESSPWVRAEVELHNSCYQLTLDMLLKPTQWFAAFYPVFESIQYVGDRQELEYKERVVIGTLEHSIKWIKHQAGGHLAAIRQMYSDTELLDLLCRPEAIPESFLVANKAAQNVLAPSASLTDEPGWIEA